MAMSAFRLPAADALIARLPLLWRMLAAMLLLSGGLLALVQSRAGILRSGTEVRLKTVPVDPRDLFRGDYVVLAYPISLVEATPAGGAPPFRRGETVYVSLAADAEGFARATGVARARPAVSGTDVVMAGRVVSTGACAVNEAGQPDCAAGARRLRIAYGLESYFVPQGQGRRIETTPRARIEVVAAVSASGEAAIKRLLIDGKLVYAEPPY
ncbi:GDYXXLXY domain-containing protein [Bosea sp. (in: a-proteobacteria)]|uniref:GDYXXLXY domain-containing protein n=1 Tax=Bosea sp. (in: a-proteobacteria) TaxID=1871050 RepID=UPI002733224F|nr:GDYXXLXY domain-containing protein [Bosea sp. (in: a-proteobacteria)]MDP3410949.1 GDYXXLXY domain-containing protein [Bosea sp. (in: a-proteobacteria)]